MRYFLVAVANKFTKSNTTATNEDDIEEKKPPATPSKAPEPDFEDDLPPLPAVPHIVKSSGSPPDSPPESPRGDIGTPPDSPPESPKSVPKSPPESPVAAVKTVAPVPVVPSVVTPPPKPTRAPRKPTTEEKETVKHEAPPASLPVVEKIIETPIETEEPAKP